MPVLLMTRGDAPGRDLLRRAIDARYGFQPPTLESLKVSLKGRARLARGIYKGWVPITLDISLKFPFNVRAQFAGRLVVVTIAGEVDLFDGTTLYRSGKPSDSAQENEAALRKLWVLNTLLLTPLNDMGVELRGTGEQSFDAIHKASGAIARLSADESNRVTRVSTTAFNPETGREQSYSLQPSIEQIGFGDVILPLKIIEAWDNVPMMEVTATAGQLNPALEGSMFALAK